MLGMALAGIVAAGPAAAAGSPAAKTPTGATPTAGIGVRLLDAPVSAGDDPRARVYIVDHLKPGTVIHRRIQASNSGSSPASIVFYSSAASISKGSFVGAAGHTANDLSTWTTVSPGSVTVPPGGHVAATVTIAIPKDAAPGEQYGVVWTETRTPPAAGTKVVQVSRVGIRLYVSVGPGGAPAGNFTISSLTAKRAADGHAVLVATVRNTGGRALDMSGTLKLSSGPGGLSAGPFPATLGTSLAIGDTEPVSVILDKQIPAGPWKAQVTLHSGLIEHTATATVTFPATGAAAAAVIATPRGGGHGLLYGLLAVLAALVLAALAYLIHLVNRKRQPLSAQTR
jgi:hypothetical protein